jgi:soluble lytic murein transglycosylase
MKRNTTKTRQRLLALTLASLMAAVYAPRAQQPPAPADVAALGPTSHPRLPADISQLWLVPAATGNSRARNQSPAMADFAEAVKLEVETNFAKALPMFTQAPLRQGPLGDYAIYYTGLAELRLGRPADAKRTFQTLQSRAPVGYLAEAAPLREAECDEALGDLGGAIEIYERLARTRTTAADDVLMRLGRAARASGDSEKAATAFARVYYEFPLSDLSALAGSELETLPNVQPIAPGSGRYKFELGRAERLFGSKRYAQARTAFEGLKNVAEGDDRELVNLRLAECDYFLKRLRNARDGVRPYIDHASRHAEALFFYAVSVRELGDEAEYLKTVRRLADDFPTQSWAEEALNNLATHYVVQDEDDKADETFREMARKFPAGRYAERAAWKIGWWAYKNGRYGDTITVFEKAAVDFPRSDHRPAWLYWAGRAHEALKDKALASARYALVVTDYQNSYYGRVAAKRLEDAPPQRRLMVDVEKDGAGTAAATTDGSPISIVAPLPPNEHVVRALLSIDLYDQAIDELHYAQKVWGDSAPIQATLAWVYRERGDLRAGINAMKRAYPQYLAAGGEKLPPELLKVLFPVNYWPQIRRYSAERQLDPYMVAALIAQESTFEADVRSPANAYGLMQIVPKTGRYYARSLRLPRFSIRMLTTADTNLKMGTAYFSDLVKQFGGTHYALASYNAGENRVARWIAERPGVDREEFIDDIPFPETQNYVKKILGTAEDYRRLYAPEPGHAADDVEDATPAVSEKPKPAPPKKATTKKKASAKGAAAKKKVG